MGMYKGRTFIRERVHVCGNYLDTEIYPVFQVPGKTAEEVQAYQRGAGEDQPEERGAEAD